MPTYTLSEEISAPPSVVFDLATDFEGMADTVTGITRVKMLTDGPVGVGTRFEETRIMFKREATETMEVVSFDRPKSYALAAESCGARYLSTFTVEPSASGSRIELRFEATALTFMARVMGFVMAPLMKKACLGAVAKDLADIKAAAEGTSGNPGAQAAVAG